jgi:hypothetical protein
MTAIRSALSALWWKIQTEPVAVTNAVTTLLAAGVSFGLYSADKSAQLSTLVGSLIVVAGTLFARRKVTPVAKQRDLVEPLGYVGDLDGAES